MGETMHIQQKIEDMIDYQDEVIAKWPKFHKYTLGERITDQAYTIADLCEHANRHYYKKNTMQEIDVKLAQLMRMVRRANRRTYQKTVKDRKTGEQKTITLQLLDNHKYNVWSEKITEIGKMLGGWMKATGGRRTDAQPEAETESL